MLSVLLEIDLMSEAQEERLLVEGVLTDVNETRVRPADDGDDDDDETDYSRYAVGHLISEWTVLYNLCRRVPRSALNAPLGRLFSKLSKINLAKKRFTEFKTRCTVTPHIHGQANGLINIRTKHATTLLLITLWPRQRSADPRTQLLPPSLPSSGCDMNNHIMITSGSVRPRGPPTQKTLCNCVIKTAKSLGNNFERQDGREKMRKTGED